VSGVESPNLPMLVRSCAALNTELLVLVPLFPPLRYAARKPADVQTPAAMFHALRAAAVELFASQMSVLRDRTATVPTGEAEVMLRL
jgi:hypothetical protein